MNWINLINISLVVTGGFTAATYEVLAKKMGLAVGFYFRSNGIMTVIGGLVTIAALIFSMFINPWWSIFIAFALGWLLAQVIVTIFKSSSQIVCLILMLLGITLLIIT